MQKIIVAEVRMNKCKECKWLKGKRSSVGIECLQPDNQKRWNEKEAERIRAGRFYPKVVARYKMPSHTACKKFEGEKDA